MYRKPPSEDGNYRSMSYRQDRGSKAGFFSSSSEHRSDAGSERSSSSYGHDNRKSDYSYKGRSFVNSNWRRPQQQSTHRPDRPRAEDSSAILKRDTAVDNLIPHFCAKNNATPLSQANEQAPPADIGFRGENVGSGKERSQVSHRSFGSPFGQPNKALSNPPEAGSWRNSANPPNAVIPPNVGNPANAGNPPNVGSPPNLGSPPNVGNLPRDNQANIPWNIRRKFTYDMELNDGEIKRLAHPEALIYMLKSRYCLSEVITKLDQETRQVEVEEHEREEIAREHLEQEMKLLYENCKVIPYSTRVLGMAHSKCSMYLFFDAGNSYHGNIAHDKIVQDTIRKSVYDKMCDCGHCEQVRNWDVQELVTFEHIDSQMRCVVSVDNGIKHRNTLLIRTFILLDKRVRLLMLIVTDMVYRYHDLSKFFTSYILQIMVVMYLQRISDPVLPTLELLRKTLPCERVFIKGFDCSFPYDVSSFPKTRNTLSVEALLMGFCTYYLHFNWDEDIVSILGPHLKRSMFRYPQEVPTHFEPPLSSYFESLCWDDHALSMNCNLPIVIQDPLELGVNVAEKVNSTVLKIFKMMCSDAVDMLAKWVSF